MSFGGMRGGGPGCCCCNDLYVVGPFGAYRVKAQRVRVGDGTVRVIDEIIFPTGDYGWSPYTMDFKNKRVYGSGQEDDASPAFAIHSTAENLTDRVELTGATGAGVAAENSHGVWPIPETEKIYYGRGPTATGATTTASLRRIDYDGTNDTELIAYAESGNNRRTVQYVTAPRSGEYIFYITQGEYIPNTTPDVFDEIHRCLPDGTGDTVLYTCPRQSNPSAEGILEDLRVDNTNQKLWFREFNIPTDDTFFQRCDFDGSNFETVYTINDVFAFRAWAFWSHKKQRYYFWRQGGTAGLRGLWSINYDGADEIHEVTSTAWVAATGEAPGSIAPGCGFEVTGDGYEV